ncbi:hypothetical protein Cni_G10141 [Canna indica]|uniref:RNase H type-1 domain-containing protein n=1 Tax=Canna indica TaxID=4628 RepID=A0AAQ3QAD4_9LILI|nr:hypothetical protein Cni_G10141 [Canna indica]
MLATGNRWNLIGSEIVKASFSLKAELESIWYGLDNVRKKNLDKVLVFSDCKEAVDMLNGMKIIPWKLKMLVENILNLGRSLNVNCWYFINMEDNMIAHAAARNALYGRTSGI